MSAPQSTKSAFEEHFRRLTSEGVTPNQAAILTIEHFRNQQAGGSEQDPSPNQVQLDTSSAAAVTNNVPSSGSLHGAPSASAITSPAIPLQLENRDEDDDYDRGKSDPKSTKRPAVNEPAAAAYVRKTPKESLLSLDDLHDVVKQCSLAGDPKLLIRMAGTFFDDEQKINNSFVASKATNAADPSSEFDASIDYKSLAEVYDIFSKETPGPMMYGIKSLLSKVRFQLNGNSGAFSDPKSLRFVLILFANPLLLDPEYTSTTSLLCKIICAMNSMSRSLLVSLFEHSRGEHFMDTVKKLQQFITLSIYMGHAIEDGIQYAVCVLGLLFQASIQVGQRTGIPLVDQSVFQNDAVNSEMSLKRDFGKWLKDMKSHGGATRGAGGWRRQIQQAMQMRKAEKLLGRSQDGFQAAGLRNSSKSSIAKAAEDSVSQELKVIPSETEAWQQPVNLKMLQNQSDFSFCACNYVLDTGSKAEILRYDARQKQYHAVMENVHQAQNILHNSDIYLILNVDRNNIIQSTMQSIASIRTSDLKKPLKVRFNGERGIDEGGVKKEFFQIILRELFDPNYGMFNLEKGSRLYFFSPDSFTAPIEFELIGTILGLAIFNSVILEVNFPSIVYHMLVGNCISLDHLKDLHPTVYKSFKQLLSCDDASLLDLNFEISRQTAFGEEVTNELKEGGSKILVTNENRSEFVDLYVRHLLYFSVKTPFDAFLQGFAKVCDSEVLDWFHPDEIELLVCGSQALDFEDLKQGARYDGFDEDSQIIKNLWSIVLEMTVEQQKQFLCFATGSSRSPIRGLSELHLTITRAGPDSDQLPTSHTCFNNLVLPEYS